MKVEIRYATEFGGSNRKINVKEIPTFIRNFTIISVLPIKKKKKKLLTEWSKVEDQLPENEVNVLCYHEYSGNYFICYRTTDCLTGEPKWFNGSMPTHWKPLDKPFCDSVKNKSI